MGPDWSIVDSDEFDLEDDEVETEEEDETEKIYQGKKFKEIFLPRALVNGNGNFAPKIKDNGDVDSLKFEENEREEEVDDKETRNEEEDNEEEEEEEEDEEEDEEEEEESYREGQVFKSLLMLAR